MKTTKPTRRIDWTTMQDSDENMLYIPTVRSEPVVTLTQAQILRSIAARSKRPCARKTDRDFAKPVIVHNHGPWAPTPSAIEAGSRFHGGGEWKIHQCGESVFGGGFATSKLAREYAAERGITKVEQGSV